MRCCIRCTGLTAWFHRYDDVQFCTVILLYLEVVCSLIGSFGAFYTGVLVANLAIALFGLVAVESGSQTLGRAYAAFLALSLLVDILWFIFFILETRADFSETSSLVSVEIVFWMQVSSCTLRLLSSFLWIQIYRLGAATDNSAMYHPVDFEGRIASFGVREPLETRPLHAAVSVAQDILGGSIYHPASFSSHFQIGDEPYSGLADRKETEAFNEGGEINGPNTDGYAQPSDLLLEKEIQRVGVT